MYHTLRLYSPIGQRISDTWQPFFGVFNFKAMTYTDEEEWRDIPDWEDYYQISSHGRLRSLDRYVKHSRNGIVKRKGKIISLKTGDKYLVANLYKKGKMKTITVHQLVAITFHGYVKDGRKTVIDHKDNNKHNNHYKNIQVLTQRENTSKDQWRWNRTSDCIGVSALENDRWLARIKIDGKLNHLGYYSTEQAAAEAYQRALTKLNS